MARTIVALAFGLPSLLFPAEMLGLYGAQINEAATVAARFYAAELVATAVLAWQARNTIDSDARRAIVSSRCIANGLRTVIAAMAMFAGIFNARGWSVVALFAFFTIAFGYYWLGRLVSSSHSLAMLPKAHWHCGWPGFSVWERTLRCWC